MVKPIAEIEASFKGVESDLGINIQDKTGHIKLITSADQLAEVAKLLLLAGSGKIFRVAFYECSDKPKKSRL